MLSFTYNNRTRLIWIIFSGCWWNFKFFWERLRGNLLWIYILAIEGGTSNSSEYVPLTFTFHVLMPGTPKIFEAQNVLITASCLHFFVNTQFITIFARLASPTPWSFFSFHAFYVNNEQSNKNNNISVLENLVLAQITTNMKNNNCFMLVRRLKQLD